MESRSERGRRDPSCVSGRTITDPDRPAAKRMMEVPPMQPTTNGIPNTLLDESTKYQARPTVMNSLPKARELTKLESSSLPSYFGAEPFVNPSEETKAVYTNVDTPNAYMLEADFTQSFNQSGAARPTGATLPIPELRHRWKSMTSGNIESAFYDPQTTKSSQFSGLDTSDMSALKKRLDELMARLDDLEYRAAGSNPQMEMMSFIMVGLFLMFGLDIAVRKSNGMRLLNIK